MPFDIRTGRPPDLNYLISLQNKHHHEVGYTPKGGILQRLHENRILVIAYNDAPAGYIAFTHRRDGRTHVPIVCVEDALWRHHIGTALMDNLIQRARLAGSYALTLKSAIDLPANHFWPSLGMTPQAVVQPKRRALVCWALPLRPDVPLPILPPATPRNPRTHPLSNSP